MQDFFFKGKAYLTFRETKGITFKETNKTSCAYERTSQRLFNEKSRYNEVFRSTKVNEHSFQAYIQKKYFDWNLDYN